MCYIDEWCLYINSSIQGDVTHLCSPETVSVSISRGLLGVLSYSNTGIVGGEQMVYIYREQERDVTVGRVQEGGGHTLCRFSQKTEKK